MNKLFLIPIITSLVFVGVVDSTFADDANELDMTFNKITGDLNVSWDFGIDTNRDQCHAITYIISYDNENYEYFEMYRGFGENMTKIINYSEKMFNGETVIDCTGQTKIDTNTLEITKDKDEFYIYVDFMDQSKEWTEERLSFTNLNYLEVASSKTIELPSLTCDDMYLPMNQIYYYTDPNKTQKGGVLDGVCSFSNLP